MNFYKNLQKQKGGAALIMPYNMEQPRRPSGNLRLTGDERGF